MTTQDKLIKCLLAATAMIVVLCMGVMLTEQAGYAPPQLVPAAVQTVNSAALLSSNAVLDNRDVEIPPEEESSPNPVLDEQDEYAEMAVVVQDDATSETQMNTLVNINTAELDELISLPGVGPVIGQNIIDYRERVGGFSSVEQLIYVERVGEKTLANLRSLVTVG